MKLLAVIAGWVLILFGTAMGAIVLEGLLHRRRVRREASLHQRMGLGSTRGGRFQ
jgi:hypothetical protein